MTGDGPRCPNCGAAVPATGGCPYCGAAGFVDGISGRLLPSDLHCPRCEGKPSLQGVDHEGIRADLCTKCRGVWFGMGRLEQALRTAIHRPPVAGEGTSGPAHGGIEPVRYARCPVCDGGMSREALCKRPLVIIDRCAAHGDWCDGGEFSQLKAAARSGGMDALETGRAKKARGAAETTREQRDSPLGGARFAGEGLLTPEVRRSGGHSRRRDIFDLLWDLFN